MTDPAEDTGFPSERLPDGWQVWSRERNGRVVLAYRPDVFDGTDHPPECLPTIYLSNGSRRRRPGAGGQTSDEWHVTLYFEPDVAGETAVFDDRPTAVEETLDRAERFAEGTIDYRRAYQVPREGYFETLDRLVGD